MCSWQIWNYGVLLKWKLNSEKYRYVYDLIVKTDQALHNGIFVFAFASAQIKIVCGIQNIFIDEGGFQTENKHTERFRRRIARDWGLCRNQRRSSTLPFEWSVSPQTHVFGNSENGSKPSAADGKVEECNYRRSLPIEISWRKIMGRLEFADENSYTVRSVGWLQSVVQFWYRQKVPPCRTQIWYGRSYGILSSMKILAILERHFRSDGQRARIWHCVVWVSDARQRAGTRWKASADHRTNLF